MANNKLAYGLAKEHGIDTEGMTPKQVWEALSKKGISPDTYNPRGHLSTILPGQNQPITNPRKIKRLTKDEYRIWKESCEKIARGGRGSVQIGDDYYVVVNKKIVVTTGSYPFGMSQILSFETHDEQIKYLKELIERYG